MQKWMESSLLTKINDRYLHRKSVNPEEYLKDHDVVALANIIYTMLELGLIEKPIDIGELSPPIWIITANIIMRRNHTGE